MLCRIFVKLKASLKVISCNTYKSSHHEINAITGEYDNSCILGRDVVSGNLLLQFMAFYLSFHPTVEEV